MLRLSQRDIRQGYRGIKHLAKREVKRGNYEKAQEYIKHCATIAQQFNWIYADFELEDLLKIIGHKTLPISPSHYEVQENRVVFYDDFCTSFVLALQYIDALVAAGKEILYITPQITSSRRFSSIIPILSQYDNIKIVEISGSSYKEKQCQIYQHIFDFHPSQLILHQFAHSEIVPVLFILPRQIKTYLINLADQTFWLGAKAIDYVLEFRQFGVSVSQQRRGIKPEQQLLIPFYPIVDNNEFQGFPEECNKPGKVIIFSGGDIYKILDEKMTYWRLVKEILDRHPNVVFLFATKINNVGTNILDEFIKKNHFEGRFIYSSFRPDINEVMRHVDIYMGTCPVSGSLMSQLAAINAIPILQYYYPGTPDDETEQAICFKEQFSISHSNIEDFLSEADRLICDKEYRISQGNRLQRSMISEAQFNELVKSAIEQNLTTIELHSYCVDYEILTKRWFALEKCGYINSLPYIMGILGKILCVCFAPGIIIKKYVNQITMVKHYHKSS